MGSGGNHAAKRPQILPGNRRTGRSAEGDPGSIGLVLGCEGVDPAVRRSMARNGGRAAEVKHRAAERAIHLHAMAHRRFASARYSLSISNPRNFFTPQRLAATA